MISAVLYLITEAVRPLLDRLLPQDKPTAVPPYNPAAVRTEILARKRAERSKP